jgi:hypothetical protein
MLLVLLATTVAFTAETPALPPETAGLSEFSVPESDLLSRGLPVDSWPAPSPQETTEPVGVRVLSAFVGARQFDEDDWEPVEDQISFGLGFAMQGADAPVGFELADDTFLSGVGNVDVEAEVIEFSAGVHRSFAPSARLRPQIGAGLTVISVDAKVSSGGVSASEDDVGFGFYVHGGLGIRLGSSFEVGADLRAVVGAEVELGGTDVDADYLEASLFLGWHL